MANKFNPILVKKNKIDNKEKIHQDNLKKKHGVLDENVVVVEKSNVIKTLSIIIGSLIRYLSTIILVVLAFIGIVGIVFPAPREEIINILVQGFNEILSFL